MKKKELKLLDVQQKWKNWLLEYFPLKMGPCTILIYIADYWTQTHFKTVLRKEMTLTPGQEDIRNKKLSQDSEPNLYDYL